MIAIIGCWIWTPTMNGRHPQLAWGSYYAFLSHALRFPPSREWRAGLVIALCLVRTPTIRGKINDSNYWQLNLNTNYERSSFSACLGILLRFPFSCFTIPAFAGMTGWVVISLCLVRTPTIRGNCNSIRSNYKRSSSSACLGILLRFLSHAILFPPSLEWRAG